MVNNKQKKQSIENIRHSLSHLLAAAVLEKFPKAKLGIGPAIENGFYYDFGDIKISDADLPELEKKIRELIKQNLKFKKGTISFAETKKLFTGQPYKLELAKELNKNKEKISVYQSGDFIDLCAGPHVASSSEINPDAFKLTKLAGAYWRGDEKNKMLTRVYGVAFETKKGLEDYLKMLEIAEKCDHRVLGEKLNLFMFDEEIGKGLPLWLPNGYFVLVRLENFMRELEEKNGYKHVLTPILAKEDLYKKSGHLTHYKDDMYAPIEIENERYYLKPMNCPHHHSIYKRSKHSYRELPLRLAEFGNVHRYERSGVLSGLIRVRGFTQNDSHIYTDETNLEKEITDIIKSIPEIYDIFGIKNYWFRLSLPDFKNKEKYGDIKNKKMWEQGSDILKKALKNSGHKFVEAAGEATFYGPKIDIQTKNIYGKEDSLSTVQVDYYSASRFNLYYTDKDNKEKPAIIIHRAIMGSFDRFMAFLIEKTCGNLPLWLSPVQAVILPIGEKQNSYAEKILGELKKENIRAEIPDSNETLGKRIREAELKKTPYILVVGDKEIAANSVSIRQRGKGDLGALKLEKLIEKLKKEISEKTI
ncbi:MAG: threonine--tRNA ligase [Spirochaetia bacterium]|nr:MAG: threonine--tRNA ligase [Spirochaetia bacterium]